MLEDRRLLSIALGPSGSSNAVQQQTLADLPVAAQHAISSAIGQDQSAYHAASGAAGVTLANPANGFTAQVQSGVLHVSAGSNTWDMSLVGLGYGGAVQPVGTAQTSVGGNRVDSNYGPIDEWYVNGPSGLEQGFTISCGAGVWPALADPGGTSAPQSGSLTVELALGGDLTGVVNAAGDGLTLTRPDGSTALGYTGLAAYDATGKALPATMQLQTVGGRQDLLIHVNAAGARGPITIDPYLKEAMLNASDAGWESLFGYSVAISGSTVVVGASSLDTDLGAAYVFTEPGSGWEDMFQTAELISSDRTAGDWFGDSVAISGNTVVVGAYGVNDGNGAAYVFTEPASGWKNMTQTAELTASDAQVYPGGNLGYSVSIDGNTVVVGARNAFDFQAPPLYSGAAYVFNKPASGWTNMTETAKLVPSDGANNDVFGTSVSISGNTVVVGAPNATVGGNVWRGAAYVFAEPGSGWANMTETAKLTASDGAEDDFFGNSVSISGNTAVVGAFLANGVNGTNGSAYVFTEPPSGWAGMTQTAELSVSDAAATGEFGTSVSISGNTVVVGGPGATVSSTSDQGAAYSFTKPASGWADMTETDLIIDPAGAAGFEFGNSVSISGNMVVVGEWEANIGNNDVEGATYVFTNPALAVPIVTSISPSSGPTAGGTSVTITGTNLAGASAVYFGTTAVTTFTSDTGTQVVLNSPAGTAGTVDLTVVTPGGTSPVNQPADQFSYVTALSALVATPSSPQSGNVTISYTLTDAQSDPCSIAVKYSPDGGTTWNTATAGPGGDGATGLASSPSGTSHTFVWASGSDISNANNSNVEVRITPSDAGGAGTASTTSAFTVNNYANQAPTVATRATATPSPVTGTTTVLAVLGADDGGESNLTYTWATTGTPPATVNFSVNGANGAKNTTATFSMAGAYTFTVTITDAGGLTASSSVNVTVNQTLTAITVSPSTASLSAGGTQQFTATGKDQFGVALATQPTFTWGTTAGTISAGGLLAAPSTSVTNGMVTATNSTISGTATFTAQVAGTRQDTIGMYNPITSVFYLRNTNDTGYADRTFAYGAASAGWKPIAGDWNGDGTDSIGLYNPATSVFYLRNTNDTGFADLTFAYGPATAGWLPIAGDWDGDGKDTIGLYNPATSVFYLRNTNDTGYADLTFAYGPAMGGWLPIAGDWSGNGKDTIGLYNPVTSVFYLRNTNDTGYADRTFAYGAASAGWKPIAGDWNGDGVGSIGLYNPATSVFYLRNTNDTGYADLTFAYGTTNAGWMPIAGDWNGPANACLATGGAVTASANVSALSQADLRPIISEAIARWTSAGLDASAIAKLTQAQFVISDLPGSYLGETEGNQIYIDSNAAGHGWFVDPTPASDAEFTASSSAKQLQAVDPRAINGMDLLTVVEHELGHELGLSDLASSVNDLMSRTLSAGVRRSPTEADAVFADHGSWM